MCELSSELNHTHHNYCGGAYVKLLSYMTPTCLRDYDYQENFSHVVGLPCKLWLRMQPIHVTELCIDLSETVYRCPDLVQITP